MTKYKWRRRVGKMKGIIVFDFSGTILHKDVAKEASNRRFSWLGKEVNQEWLEKALATNEHYDINKELISKYTGIKDDKQLTTFMTDFFKYHVLGVVNELKEKSFQPSIVELIKELKNRDYKIAVVSGIRNDIITGVMKITGNEDLIDFVFGQPPELGISNEQNLENCKKEGEIKFVLGDKASDLEVAKKFGAKVIFVKWGHASGNEEEIADYTISEPKELLEIIK